ncbi:uncharacterized protein LOC122870533 [Siniperca chuatsi]|uniref:uncharacterized protein LOC122870533 n=1 Tax=Siniperca chuatsi TaxID=119488 RepID=UPI001CE1DD46|nr:uncharacterized protein LOC122870533 [Siniperca chuatsi]
MLKHFALYSRLLFAFALVCAAVMSFIMCSDAARASPITTQVENGVKHNVLKRLYTPYSQHPLSTSLSIETGLQTGTNSETEMSRNYREASSIIDHQSNSLQLTDGSFSYNQNIPDNRHSQVGMTRVQSEVTPASSIFTSHSQHGGQSFERWQSRVNYHPLSQKVAQSGNSYNSYPVIIRKSSHKEAASPFHQRSSPSQVWDPTNAQKSYKVPRSDSPKVAEDKTVWQPSDSSHFSSQTGRYWSTSLPAPRGHYSSYKETNELAAAGLQSTSSGIQSRKFLGFASQTAPHAPSISNSLDASVIKSNPSPEKLTSSITGFYQGLHSVSSSETPRHKKVQSYLFKDSQTSFGGHETVNTVTGDGPSASATTPHKQRPSDEVYGRFSSNFKQLQQLQRKDPTKEVQHLSDNANPLYRNANVAPVFLGFASQTAPHAPSISNSLDASVIKSNASPEKLTSPLVGFYQRLHSVSSSETPRHKKVQSHLLKDSQTSFNGHETVNTITGDGPSASATTPHKQRPSDEQVYSRFSFKQLQRKDLTNEVQHLSDNANPLYHNANVAQYGAQTDSSTKYQRTTAETLAQISVHPAPGKYDTMESFIPVTHAGFQGNYATGSDKSVVSSLVNTTTRGSMHAYKPEKAIKSIYGFGGFKNPSVLSSSGTNERNSRRYSFDKGKFKIANTYRSLSPKYSFGQREASTSTTAPAKLERTPTDYFSPSTSTLDIVQTMTTPRPFTSGFKEARPLLPESDAGMDSDPDRGQFRSYRRIYGLKGFGTQPLEGAKTSVSEPDKSTRVLQGFEGFKLRSSQIWQQKNSKIHRWYNKTGETEPGSSHVSTMSQNELSSEDLKPRLKTAGSTESVARFTPVKNNRKIYRPTSLGFHPVQNKMRNASNKTHWKYKEQNPTIASPSHRISSAYVLSSAYVSSRGDLKVESSPKSDTKMANNIKPVAMKASLFNRATSSTVRGKRVKGKQTNGKKLNESTSLTNAAIVRLSKRPARVKAVTYADILGSASFSGVTATVTPADKDYFPNAAATTKHKERVANWTLNSEDAVHSRDNTSRGPEAHAEDDKEDFSSVEENNLGVRSEDVYSDMKTSDLFLDNDGSGNGGFNISVFSADTTKSQGLSEDLLELDYLQISTGNISFKSMKQSNTEK